VEPDKLISELVFKAVRSSGSGGQHVNKVSSKVVLSFNISNSETLSDTQKELLKTALVNRLNTKNELVLHCDESRSQHKNKSLVIMRFLQIIKQGLIIPKKRIPTKTPKSVIRKRLKNKKKQSDRKTNRKKPNIE